MPDRTILGQGRPVQVSTLLSLLAQLLLDGRKVHHFHLAIEMPTEPSGELTIANEEDAAQLIDRLQEIHATELLRQAKARAPKHAAWGKRRPSKKKRSRT